MPGPVLGPGDTLVGETKSLPSKDDIPVGETVKANSAISRHEYAKMMECQGAGSDTGGKKAG